MNVDKEPLWSEEGEFLGYSCCVTVNLYAVAQKLHYKYDMEKLREQMGINENSKGVTWDKDLKKRVYIFEWFQPGDKREAVRLQDW
jgi:hypothetical protein